MNSDQPQYVEELPVTELPRVGSKLASVLEKIGIFQVKDLLFHLPYRYQDRTRTVPLDSLIIGQSMLVCGRIITVRVEFGRRRSLIAKIGDGTGNMCMRLFHFSNRQKENLERAAWLRCFGEVRRMRTGYEMVHPEYSVFDHSPAAVQGDSLTPVYRLTEGVGQALMRATVKSALNLSKNQEVLELLPPQVLEVHQLPDLKAALEFVHAPPSEKFELTEGRQKEPAMQRLIFEELVAFQIARRQHKKLRQSIKAPKMEPSGELSRRLKESLAFKPTESQRKVIYEILADLKRSMPMLRLVQGDVGSGKTLVAAAAAAWVVESGYQVAIMAPTELLAEQHLKSFVDWFAPLGIDIQLLTGRLSAKERRNVEHAVQWGGANIVIGTHALFQEGVDFKNLGLVVIDEQHRFGVGQRYAFRKKGVMKEQVPHQLVMTATPIPRTLAMTFYADLDVSSITELPPGRIPVRTEIIPSSKRSHVVGIVERLCVSGQQAYWVCPIIEKSEVLDVESAEEAEKFVKQALPGRRVALIHGRLKSVKRDQIMTDFRNGKIDVLVATTVIEVGVDVPNASLMVIESSERLGLSQLHQLRGRVGRGLKEARCILLFKKALSEMAIKRLTVMQKSNDGFKIAETDLKLRGAGELLGTRQTGAQLFRIAELPRDMELITDVNQVAQMIMDEHPDYIEPLIRRWTVQEGGYSAV